LISAEYYPAIRLLHMTAASVSGALFVLRGVGMWLGSSVGMRAPIRYLSYAIDTVLLSAAVLLAAMLHRVPLVDPWITTKIGLVLLYIVLGSFALKRAPTALWRRVCFVAAVGVFLCIVWVARHR
jgi:uncharacterized membrane protein SirB2